jgi:hypothetical protein
MIHAARQGGGEAQREGRAQGVEQDGEAGVGRAVSASEQSRGAPAIDESRAAQRRVRRLTS